MSKHLIKILSVFALVVLLPLIVVGSALCVTEAVPCTLTIFEGGREGQYGGTDSEIVILIDGVEQVDDANEPLTSIKVNKNTEVTVSYTGKGYDFLGWYAGNPKEVDETDTAQSQNAIYTFTLKKSTTLTALRNVTEYQITYGGTYDDRTTPITDGDISGGLTQVVEYNQSLATLVPKVGAEFDGWSVYKEGITDATGVFNAIFNEANKDSEGNFITINLRPRWSNQMAITYYTSDGSKVIAQDIVTESSLESYELLASTDSRVVENITRGYEFAAWTDINGTPIDISTVVFEQGEFKIYLKENLINYSMNVAYNAIDSDNVTTLTYNVVDKFSTYNVERDGYNFVGFVYDGNTYTLSGNDYIFNGNSLGDILINAEEDVTVTALWDSLYNDITWHVDFSNEDDMGYNAVYYFDGTNYNFIDSVEEFVIFKDVAEEGFRQAEDEILASYFTQEGLLNNLYIKVGEEYQKVTASNILVQYDTNPMDRQYIEFSENITFKTVMDILETNGITGYDQLTISIICE